MCREPRRVFITKSYTARTAPDFSPLSAASSAGRLDVICRCVMSAFKTSHGLRSTVTFYAVLAGPPNPPLVLKVSEPREELLRDEVAVAEAIANAMKRGRYEGFEVFKGDLSKVLVDLTSTRGKIACLVLSEAGEDALGVCERIKGVDIIAIALGTQVDLDPRDLKVLESLRPYYCSLGPLSYLASHAIVLINYFLDLMSGC